MSTCSSPLNAVAHLVLRSAARDSSSPLLLSKPRSSSQRQQQLQQQRGTGVAHRPFEDQWCSVIATSHGTTSRSSSTGQHLADDQQLNMTSSGVDSDYRQGVSLPVVDCGPKNVGRITETLRLGDHQRHHGNAQPGGPLIDVGELIRRQLSDFNHRQHQHHPLLHNVAPSTLMPPSPGFPSTPTQQFIYQQAQQHLKQLLVQQQQQMLLQHRQIPGLRPDVIGLSGSTPALMQAHNSVENERATDSSKYGGSGSRLDEELDILDDDDDDDNDNNLEEVDSIGDSHGGGSTHSGGRRQVNDMEESRIGARQCGNEHLREKTSSSQHQQQQQQQHLRDEQQPQTRSHHHKTAPSCEYAASF